MINEFMKKHSLSQYRMAKLLSTTGSTVARWRKDGPPNPLIMSMALETLARKLRKEQ